MRADRLVRSCAAIALLVCAIGQARATPGWQIIQFGGGTVSVPGDWPVIDLGARPQTCVRFDVHAVYVGHAGTAQDCPARATGKTDSVQIEPLASLPVPADPAVTHAIEVPRAGAMITVNFGDDDLVARAIVASITGAQGLTPARAAPPQTPEAQTPKAQTSKTASNTGVDYPAMRGFDACTAPSLSSMRAWMKHSPYRAIGIYLGGANRACGDGNLSASWVRSIETDGWSAVPIYVGLQAPCGRDGLAHISTTTPSARAQGTAAAKDAAARAQRFGIGAGNPIYFDMEAYRSGSSCRKSVLTFLSAWTDQLHRTGYISGVYGSAGSTIEDLSNAYGSSSYTRPDDVWIARWNDSKSTTDACCPSSQWSGARLHQYHGGHHETYGGVRINIDNNFNNGAVVVPGPLTTFATTDGAILVGAPAGTDMVRGTTIGFFGIRSVSVTYTLAAAPPTTVSARISCKDHGHTCTWRAALPTIPGRYAVQAIGRDKSKRVEVPVTALSLIVV